MARTRWINAGMTQRDVHGDLLAVHSSRGRLRVVRYGPEDTNRKHDILYEGDSYGDAFVVFGLALKGIPARGESDVRRAH